MTAPEVKGGMTRFIASFSRHACGQMDTVLVATVSPPQAGRSARWKLLDPVTMIMLEVGQLCSIADGPIAASMVGRVCQLDRDEGTFELEDADL